MKTSLLALLLIVTVTNAAERPNILFFLVDDMGSQDTSVPFHYNNKGEAIITKSNRIFRTPNMEKLAKNGIRFTNAYAYSVCSPTRVSILTGQSALRHKVTTWTDPDSQHIDTGAFKNNLLQSARWNQRGIPKNATLLPQLMQQAGYHNIFAGKAHFGPNDTLNGNPLNLGFHVNIAGHGAGGPGSYYGEKNYGTGKWHVPNLKQYHGTKTHLTEALTIEINKVISQTVKKEKPFFAYMSHYAVHAPFEPDPRFTNNYPTLKGHDKAYATLVEGMDKSLGDILHHIDKLGVAENTLVIFYSDNGSARMIANGQPHRGMKGHRHEGGIRVPLIAAWAKHNPHNKFQRRLPIKHNSVQHDIVTCMDILPTLTGVAGATLPKNSHADGHSLLPYLKGTKGTHRPQQFIAHFPHGKHNNTLFTSYRKDNWKLIYSYQSKQWELYNLDQDQGETKNILKTDPQQARKLAKQLINTLTQYKAEFPRHSKTNQPLLPDLSTIPSP